MNSKDMNANAESVHKTFKSKMTTDQTKVNWDAALGRRRKEDEKNSVGTIERIDFYDKNAEVYATDTLALGYSGPPKAAEIVHQYFQDNTDACILDVGCGDGLMVENLNKAATYSNMHGLDPSTGMLERARNTGLYTKLYNKYFTTDTGIEHDTYDGLVCCGAFIPGHLRAKCITEMYNLVKPGALIIIVMRECLLHVDEDLKQITPIIRKLVDQGKIEIVEEYKFGNFFANFDGKTFVLKKN